MAKSKNRRTPQRSAQAILETQLTQLETAQLVRHLVEEEPAYIFKPALTQDATYHSVLKSRRAELHRPVAPAMLDSHSLPASRKKQLDVDERKWQSATKRLFFAG